MSWLSHEIHVLEADGLHFVANSILEPNVPKIDAFFEGKAPQGVEALVTLIETDDKQLGPVASGLINSTIDGYKTQIEAEFAALVAEAGAEVTSYGATLVKAINATADKLAAN